jgi:predicted HicB family RNase H-like nuclease
MNSSKQEKYQRRIKMVRDTLLYKGFYGSIHYTDDDKCLFGHIIGITDSVSYEGTTIEEITNDFHQAVDDYIDVCKTIGKTPLKSAKGSFNVRIGEEAHLKALIKADMKKTSLNQIVKEAVEKEIQDIKLAI